MKLLASTAEAEAFLKEWYSPEPYVTAHTSGSTGTPKAVRLLKSDMIASADATNRFFNISDDSLLVSPLSASYIAGKMMIVRAIRANAALKTLQPSNSLELEGDISLLPVVPSQIDSLLKTERAHIRNVIVGGAPVSPSIEERLCRFPAKCFATYGMTETCSHVAIRRMGSPLFEALPGITFSVDADSRLCISLRNFSFKSLQTNDVVELHSPYAFRWLGRFDNVVNSGGIKLFPETIEKELAPFISGPYYLCGMPHPKWGEQLVMCVTADTVVDTAGMERHIHRYKLPKLTVVLDRFEYTSSGKIKRILPALDS